MKETFSRRHLTGLLLPTILFAGWWYLSADSTSAFVPPLSTIMETFVDTWVPPGSHFTADLFPSMRRMFVGYTLAVAIGISAGMLLGRVRWLDDALQPTIQFLRAIPGIAFVPLTISVFGIGDAGKIWLIAFVCCVPILLSTIDGARSVDPLLNDMVRVFHLNRRQRVLAVQLPAAALHIAAGMRISLSIAFILIIVSEMMGATNGIGFVTINAQHSFQVPIMWSGMVLLGILGVCLNALFMVSERRLLKWHYRSVGE